MKLPKSPKTAFFEKSVFFAQFLNVHTEINILPIKKDLEVINLVYKPLKNQKIVEVAQLHRDLGSFLSKTAKFQ